MHTSALNLDNSLLLRSNLSILNALLRTNGVEGADSADISYSRFAALDSEKQQEILANISAYLQVLSQSAVETEKIPIKENVEVTRLRNALGAFGLRFSDDAFTNLIKDDHIVEIYSETGVQLYRNMLFCKVCSYSVLDLAVNSWDELYDKPASVVQKIHDHIQKVMTTDRDLLPFDIDTFVQKEKFAFGKTLRTYMVSPRYITSLVDIASGRKTAFITTFKAEIIAQGPESSKFRIL